MIVPIGREHLGQVARLHCASLTGLLSELGIAAARAFYAGGIKAGSASGFVDVEQGLVRGFVFGAIHPDRLKQSVLRWNPVGTLVGTFLGILRHPSALVWLVKSFKSPDEGSYDAQAAELTYLAVASECRSRGRGRDLVDAFTNALRAAGVRAYEVSVDDDNRQAIAFYERLGFRLIGRYREFGILHRRYGRESHPLENNRIISPHSADAPRVVPA